MNNDKTDKLIRRQIAIVEGFNKTTKGNTYLRALKKSIPTLLMLGAVALIAHYLGIWDIRGTYFIAGLVIASYLGAQARIEITDFQQTLYRLRYHMEPGRQLEHLAEKWNGLDITNDGE